MSSKYVETINTVILIYMQLLLWTVKIDCHYELNVIII